MFMLYFTWSYCKQLASNVKLATGKYKIISRQLGSFEVLFSRPAEVPVAMGKWATVNFCPWYNILFSIFDIKQGIYLKRSFYMRRGKENRK
jgi:hypothetical protein